MFRDLKYICLKCQIYEIFIESQKLEQKFIDWRKKDNSQCSSRKSWCSTWN